MSSDPDKFKLVHPRIPVDVYGALVDYARRSHRTITGAIVHLLTIGLRCEEDREASAR